MLFKLDHETPKIGVTPWETNIALENGPFEDDFPIENGNIPASYASLPEGNKKTSLKPPVRC